MVRCNLSVLLAERRIKISRISVDTGLSRTTLTALANNYSQGIQFDTLNTLCLYLDTTPEKLVAFHPTDFRVKKAVLQSKDAPDQRTYDIYIDVVEHRRLTSCVLIANVECFYDEACPCFRIEVFTADPDNIDVFEANTDLFLQEFKDLPISFRQDLADDIFRQVANDWTDHHEPVLASFTWRV